MKLLPEDIEDFYSEHLACDNATRVTQRDGSVELTTRCPFHKDENPSFSVNLSKGLYHCHTAACPQSDGGSIYKFYSVVKEVDISIAREELNTMYRKDVKKLKDFPHTEENIESWHNALMGNKVMMSFLHKNCLYTENTIQQFELGWDGTRITIPIRKDGQLVNIRKYAPNGKVKDKVIGVRGFNTANLWPLESLDNEEVFLFEGEKDCMLANQLGLPALTVTGGAGSFNMEWRKFFIDKTVHICYDIDPAGQEGATKVADMLAGTAKAVKIIQLPISEPDNADFTDFILQRHTIQSFHNLVEQAIEVDQKEETYVDINDKIIDTTLEKASYDGYYFQRLRIKVRILGKDLAPFIIPRKITGSCSDGKKQKCLSCGLTRYKGNTTSITLDETRPELLSFLNCTTSQQRVILRQAFRIAGQCNTFNVLQEDHQYVEEVTCIPYIDEQAFDEEYIRRTVYVINNKLETNRDYEVEALTVPDPRTQHLVHIVYSSSPCETSIEEFKMTEELYKELEVFQCAPKELEQSSTISTTT